MKHRIRDEGGAATVEFAIVGLLFFMIVFGIFEFSRMFQGWVTVQHASREAARYASTGRGDCPGVSDDREECIVRVAEEQTQGLKGGGISGSRVEVSYASGDYPDFTPMVEGDAGEQCDAIEVKVTYAFEFVLPPISEIFPSGFDLEGRQRTLNEPYGSCTKDDDTGPDDDPGDVGDIGGAGGSGSGDDDDDDDDDGRG